MPLMMLECKNCKRIFSSGINMGVGSSATFIGNKSQCPFCGSMENIPDGTFKATFDGFIRILQDSDNPLIEAKKLLDEIQKNKTQEGLDKLKTSSKFSKWLPDSIEKIALYVAILKTIVDLLIKNPATSIEYNTFITQYNQVIVNMVTDSVSEASQTIKK